MCCYVLLCAAMCYCVLLCATVNDDASTLLDCRVFLVRLHHTRLILELLHRHRQLRGVEGATAVAIEGIEKLIDDSDVWFVDLKQVRTCWARRWQQCAMRTPGRAQLL